MYRALHWKDEDQGQDAYLRAWVESTERGEAEERELPLGPVLSIDVDERTTRLREDIERLDFPAYAFEEER